MPFNGSGGFELPSNSWNPAVGGTTVDSADWNSTASDIETGFSSVICRDGQSTITANLPMSGFKHTGVNTNSGNLSRSEYASGAALQDGAPLDAGYTAGTSTVYTANLAPAIAAYADKQCFRVIFDQACGATPTINFNAVGAKKIYYNSEGTITQITTGDIPDDYPAILRYDSTLDAAAGAFWLMNPVQSVAAGDITPVQLASSTIAAPVNFTFAVSVAASALTIAVKGEDGNDPSATNVVKLPIPDQTGGYDVLSLTGATSLVVSSGSTLGTTNGVLYRLWVVGFNDAGTFRLGIINTQISAGIFPLSADGVASSTAEGGAGGADSAGVYYTGSAVTDKAFIVLGYLESTQATAGTWATGASKAVTFKPGMKLPGDVVQPLWNVIAAASGATFFPLDNTTPLITEGTEIWSQAITPRSAANRIRIRYSVHGIGGGGSGHLVQAAFRGNTCIGAVDTFHNAATFDMQIPFETYDNPATTSSVTYSARAGMGDSGGTWYIAQSDTAWFNGELAKMTYTIEELMA